MLAPGKRRAGRGRPPESTAPRPCVTEPRSPAQPTMNTRARIASAFALANAPRQRAAAGTCAGYTHSDADQRDDEPQHQRVASPASSTTARRRARSMRVRQRQAEQQEHEAVEHEEHHRPHLPRVLARARAESVRASCQPA